jgi:predicted small lipoprotein YifL
VVINNSTFQRGQNGTITVDLTAVGGADPENAVSFSMMFDPTQLAFISAVPGSGAPGSVLLVNQSMLSSGLLGLSLAMPVDTGFSAGTHQILVITMLALANGTASLTGTAFADSPIQRELVTAKVQPLPANWINGTAGIVNGCVYTISPLVRHYSAKGGTGSVDVTTGPGCPWSVSNFAPFVNISSGSTGIGNGTVNFSVVANAWIVRSGQVYVAGNVFTVRQGANFLDVPADDIFYENIGRLSAARITLGCDTEGLRFCPTATVTREQMAAFIIRALGNFNPPTPSSQRFLDVPPTNTFYAFIDDMAIRGVTLGCNATGPLYCPSANVTREQMAAFIIRAIGNPNPVMPQSQRFLDVLPSNTFYAFIDDMAIRGITLGCNAVGPLYCPSMDVSRGQMAAFLTRTFVP